MKKQNKKTKLAALKQKNIFLQDFFCFPGDLLELWPEVWKLAADASFQDSLFDA